MDVPEVDLTSVADQIPQCQDFTVTWQKGDGGVPGFFVEHFKDNNKAIERQVQIKLSGWSSLARASVCLCYRTQFYSATFRSDDTPPKPPSTSPQPVPWRCSPWGKGGLFLVEAFEMAEAIRLAILSRDSSLPPTGLIVFAGATNSAKSNLARAFALRVIQLAASKRGLSDRIPHLVTCEDPIESWAVTQAKSPPALGCKDTSAIELDPKSSRGFGFSFTPRESDDKDVNSLKTAIADAKRQTPTCFYVGEIRDEKEWECVIRFAGSGHLVVATTHAARLTETVAQIIEARAAYTPGARRSIGGNLTGCIHLQCDKVSITQDNNVIRKSVVFPTIWAHHGAALNSLVADGLSSIIPNGTYVLSRHQFFNAHFRPSLSPDNSDGQPPTALAGCELPPVDKELKQLALIKATELDIQDLLQQ